MSIAWSDLFVAFGLYMVLEGLIPFLSPQAFKRYLIRVVSLSDTSIRNVGMLCVGLGLLLIYFVRQGAA